MRGVASLVEICAAAENHFIPARPIVEPFPLDGRRRAIEQHESRPLRWPTDKKARFEAFDAWHDVAMQICHRAKAGLHIMAVAKKVIIWKDGSIAASNADLAARAGFCSVSTIKRELKAYIGLGLLMSETEWKRPGGGKFITVRTLRPAFPVDLPDWVILPHGADLSEPTRGPDLDGASEPTRGPYHEPTRGPSTIETITSGGVDASR